MSILENSRDFRAGTWIAISLGIMANTRLPLQIGAPVVVKTKDGPRKGVIVGADDFDGLYYVHLDGNVCFTLHKPENVVTC